MAISPRRWAPTASVIIPVKDAARTLGRCLAGVGECGIGDLEVIVVDDHSQDGSAALASQLGARVVHLTHGRGAAAARNLGARRATGDLLIFLDSDVVPVPGALERLVRTLRDKPNLAAVMGVYEPKVSHLEKAASRYQVLATHYHHAAQPGEVPWFWTALACIRRSVLTECGGFDESYTGAAAEDMELGQRLSRTHQRLRNDPLIRGVHWQESGTWPMLMRNLRKSASLGRTLALNRTLTRAATPYSTPSTAVPGAAAVCAAVSLPAGIFHWAGIVLSAGCLATFGAANARLLWLAFRSTSWTFLPSMFILRYLAVLAATVGFGAGAAGGILSRYTRGEPA